MMLVRTQIPGLKSPGKFNITHAESRKLNNGLTTYVINAGSEPVVKLELVFPSGTTGSTDYTLATAAHQLMDSGTVKKTAPEIAEAFDYYGAYLQTDFGPDWKSVNLYSLTRFFADTLPALMEILQEATYPSAELENWKIRTTQSLKVNREKVSWIAKKTFSEMLFGKDHPYGYSINEEDIRNLNAASLPDYYSRHYNLSSALVIVSGNVTDAVMKTLDTILGSVHLKNEMQENRITVNSNGVSEKKLVSKKDAIQSGIRIGKILFSKTHPDFPALQITNTILGGYFGSRLMSNIREDKGYTYGIGSGIHPYRESGFFFISTEVGNQVRDAAIREIYFELNRLAEEPVPMEELQLVKNYLTGAFQRSLDGPFSLSDRFKGIHLFGLDYSYIEKYLETLRNIDPPTVMKIAATYLQPGSMTEVIAG